MAKYHFPPGDVAESIATALSIRTKRPIDKSQVVVEPYRDVAGQYVVTIYETPDIAKKVIPFLDKFGHIPIEVGDLCPIGYKTNRTLHEFNPWQHGQIIGATEAGKSSCLHGMLAHVTRCPLCFIWVGGVWKLYDFVSSWVEPYLNTEFRPPIDWITHGQLDVCHMIAAFLDVAAYRLNLRNYQRVNLPYGILILDEVTYIAGNRMIRVPHGGEDKNASRLISDVAKGTAGAKEYMWYTAQRDTMDVLGDDGGMTQAQMGFSFIFYIKDSGAVGRITNDYGLDTPRSKGECWADFGMSGGIHKLRIPYPQSDDPLKEVLHNGPKVSEIAWKRRHIKHELDLGSANAAGQHYADRHLYVTDDYLDYLTKPPQTNSAASTTGNGILMEGMLTAGMSAEIMQAEQDYARMVAQASGGVIDSDGHATGTDGQVLEAMPNSAKVVDLSRYATLSTRIMAVCKLGDPPRTRKEIISEMEALGATVKNPNTVTTELGNLVRSDPPKLGKTPDGKYYAL